MNQIFDDFMHIYLKFLSKDLIASLEMDSGRSEKVIAEFVRIFCIITDSRFSPLEKKKVLFDLDISVNSYVNKGDRELYSKMEDELRKRVTIDSSGQRLDKLCVSLQSNLSKFVIANEDYKQRCPQTIYFKQSLIEFNNALSHVFNIYLSRNKMHTNLSRANTHLHRGALDYYKTIIREKHTSMSVPQINHLMEIRLKEYDTVGHNVKYTPDCQKQDLVDTYKVFATAL